MGSKRHRAEVFLGSRYGLEIRSALPADAPGLTELLSASGYPVPSHLLAEQLEALRYGHGTALLALEWGPPSGIVVLHWYPVLEQAAPRAQITMLLVAPEGRRRGVGRQWLKSAAQAARMAGCGAIELLAAAEARGLADFCVANGFTAGGSSFVRSLRKKG
jgi:aminoglycoside 6'-N-acetyltransferase I